MKKLLLLFSTLLVLAACSSGEESNTAHNGDKKQEVKLVLDWTPNTNHTGLYVAQAEGYFAEQGLDVEIMLPGEAGADQLVASGKADFGISAQETVTEARIQEIPIVSIGAIIQHNTSGFASPEEKDITSPEDFEGKTYGGWGAPVEKAVLSSLMKKENADVEKVNIINMGNTDFFTAVKRDVDFAWIYYGWTGVEAELRGQELNMMYLTDYSEKLDYYTPILTTSESMMADNPETVEAFMAAVSKGYQFAIDHPDKAADLLIEAVPDLDPELVHASQEWLSPKYQADAKRWGQQDLEVWKNYAEWMYNHDLLNKKLKAKEAFTNKFLPEK
ncbi:ABC transporter substrate-binding protein [Halobacillus naozhouensis]|uniref:ABC transporter substrate-binding protein n=1 Tax=Halobacillus naozhouensis TaxID=554880 RepID=A0ABY8IZQ2_9BACI|nr:ABC transporter substrate-binding protein [Halobacillus naozhouensis]WFT75722.1 ABC transporter substrate-binding protein [Halobacillus naozhouensis]